MPNSSQKPQQGLANALLLRLLQHVAERAENTTGSWSEHGLLALLDHLVIPAAAIDPPAARSARRELLAQELLHQQLLDRLHDALREAGIAAVLIKGEALARSLYPAAALRPRHDIDLWIAPAQRIAVEAVLRGLGGVAVASAWGQWIQPEQLWRFAAGSAAVGIDLHWQFCSRPALLPALALAGVLQRSAAFSSACSGTAGLRLPAHVDALLLACVHRRAHHRASERWIWLFDIALLWESLPAAARTETVTRAIRDGVAALLADGLAQVAPMLSEPPAADCWSALHAAAAMEPARLLLRDQRHYSDFRFDLRFPGAATRRSVLRDYLLPRAEYMHSRYRQVRPRWLPWLYLRRLLLRLT